MDTNIRQYRFGDCLEIGIDWDPEKQEWVVYTYPVHSRIVVDMQNFLNATPEADRPTPISPSRRAKISVHRFAAWKNNGENRRPLEFQVLQVAPQEADNAQFLSKATEATFFQGMDNLALTGIDALMEINLTPIDVRFKVEAIAAYITSLISDDHRKPLGAMKLEVMFVRDLRSHVKKSDLEIILVDDDPPGRLNRSGFQRSIRGAVTWIIIKGVSKWINDHGNPSQIANVAYNLLDNTEWVWA